MPYFQILQQRRLALGLSIEDIASQTRLAPQYIQAIEANNLSVFDGDMVFVQQFIQAYCEAIGVNYQAIRMEVEANIQAFVAQSTASVQPTAQTTAAPRKRAAVRRKRKSKKTNWFVRMRKAINQSEHAMYYRIGILALAGVVILSLINLGVTYSSNRRAQAQEEARQAALEEKENETNRLAQQKKENASGSSDIEITTKKKEDNVFEITNVLEGDKSLEFNISMPKDSTVVIYKDNDVVSGEDTDYIYTSTYDKKISVSSECTIQLEIGSYSDNKIKINGKTVKFDKTNWSEDSPAVLYFDVKKSEEKSDSKKESSSSDEKSEDTSTENTDDQTTTTTEETTDDQTVYYTEEEINSYDPSLDGNAESNVYYDEYGNIVAY